MGSFFFLHTNGQFHADLPGGKEAEVFMKLQYSLQNLIDLTLPEQAPFTCSY
jgi:hypothetical protein